MILITGSEGYIGTNLKNLLRYQGIVFEGIDKKIGYDVLQYEDFKDVNLIVHLAAVSGIQACNKDLDMAIRDNISTANHVFRGAFANNIPVVFTSSQAAKNPLLNSYAMMKKIIEKEAERLNDMGAKIEDLFQPKIQWSF